MKKNHKIAAFVGGAVGVAAIGVASFAAFTSVGQFAAGGHVSQAPLNLTSVGNITDLYPGDCSDVTVSFHNPNDHDAVLDLSNIGVLLGSVHAVPSFGPVTSAVVNTGGPQFTVLPTSPDANLANFTVPANGDKTAEIDNAVCLSKNVTNAAAGQAVTLVGTVPFAFAGSEYKG